MVAGLLLPIMSDTLLHLPRAHTDNIALYNKTDTACCADSGASEDMFTDYSNFKTYHRLSTLGDPTADISPLLRF